MMQAGTDLDACVAWAKSQLQDGENYHSEQICLTPYSCVMRLTNGDSGYYLKQTPPHLFREAAVTELLERIAPGVVPHVHASNVQLGCFLIEDAGVQMRAYLKSGGDLSMLVKTLKSYAGLQRATAAHIDELWALGVPDWRLTNLPDLFTRLIYKPEVTAAGLTPVEQKALEAYTRVLKAQCSDLAAYGIPETIEHPDFQDKNMVVSGEDVRVIDWGEAVISHPFFSMARCMFSVGRHHGFDAAHPSALLLKSAYLAEWAAYVSPEDINTAYSLVEKLSLPYSALAYAQLADACGAEGQHFWSGSIVPLLQSILLVKE